jgi:hypothetical protein
MDSWMIHREINVKIKSFYPLNDEFNNPVKSPSWGITYQQNSLFLSHFAGTPLTVTPAGTSLVTTAPAPTMALSPIVTPGKINAPMPINTSFPIVQRPAIETPMHISQNEPMLESW